MGVPTRLAFIRPLAPASAVRPPKGDDWLHEPKWDGFRFQVIKDGSQVRFYSRHAAECTDRLPGMAEAFAKLPTSAAILDRELCLIGPRGAANFYRLMNQTRTSHTDESQLMFLAFDLLHQDGVDLRGLPLSERKRDLDRHCRKSKVPYLSQVETFPDGAILFDYCSKYGFEGVVSKRRSSRYSSGPSRNWSRQSALIASASTRSGINCSKVRASPSLPKPNRRSTPNNVEINGPEIVLRAEAGQAMAMVLHELTTNAAKYGALSTGNGRVSIRWDEQPNGHSRSCLVFEWQEIGGPLVEAPGNPSYGTTTIRDLIPYEFGGTVDLVLALDGVRCRLELPADWLSNDSKPVSETNVQISLPPGAAHT